MKKVNIIWFVLLVFVACERFDQYDYLVPTSSEEDTKGIMSKAYWAIWNEQIEKMIDENIDIYRKADAVLSLNDIPENTTITITQTTHEFVFGAQIFNFNQLGSDKLNSKYKETFGSLFNSATIPFYWKDFEPEPGFYRFEESFNDSEDFWNHCPSPTSQTYWRRPPTDPIVEFCKSKNLRIHGHTLIWGNRFAQTPTWIWDFIEPREKDIMDSLVKTYANEANGLHSDEYNDEYSLLTPIQLETLLPNFTNKLKILYSDRITNIANHYNGQIDSWDVVNEATSDYVSNLLIHNDNLCKSIYGIMPGDYVYRSFETAASIFPKNVLLNINDYILDANYASHIEALLLRGCKIDIVGAQMHLDLLSTRGIVNGEEIQTPKQIRDWIEILSETGLPIHISEITIPCPEDNVKNQLAQAVIARNLYRLWFSSGSVMGITWWNLVDECGAIGQPRTSGLFRRDMTPKPSYYALFDLINKEWKTTMQIALDSTKIVKFRGFKGKYIVSWTDDQKNINSLEFYLKNDGDGL